MEKPNAQQARRQMCQQNVDCYTLVIKLLYVVLELRARYARASFYSNLWALIWQWTQETWLIEVSHALRKRHEYQQSPKSYEMDANVCNLCYSSGIWFTIVHMVLGIIENRSEIDETSTLEQKYIRK